MKHAGNALKYLSLLFMFVAFPYQNAVAQNGNVKGTVVADDGPIIGATVRVKGQPNMATVTDLDGNFTLKAPKGATLQISYLGYKDKEVKVGNGPIDVTLVTDAQALSEVVVVGYGTMRKADLTGAVTQVDNKALRNQSQRISTRFSRVVLPVCRFKPTQVLLVVVVPSASAVRTLNATSQPIFVIDGVIIDSDGSDNGNSNPLAGINPSDILTMDILKDASATAIYGSRASNGVIMITTKRGQNGEAQITYDGYVGWQAMPKNLT